MTDETLWTARELARFLGYCESTVSRMVTQEPDKLPPRVASLGRPRWVPEVAREWARQTSAPPRSRVGRPRNQR
ncbi:MAG: hypothetical protein EOO76_07605 [Novosphingobium sp.]|nr:MAG: hypothetical protein EOO76_07605 [Novosphingobium sp.]